MAESLAVKYRPKEFSEAVGQDAIITILEKQLEKRNFKNAFLFCGASGCGKTTVARIFANKINEGYGEPIEIDAASNNGVDNIRDIVSAANERSIDSEYKIYIIDECHTLTPQSWQAFLKCLEEPPKYTIFIFCTTDPQKIPDTILNRVMRFNFNRIKTDAIIERLKFICEQEGFTYEEKAIDYLARVADGGMRTAISLLDKVASYNKTISLNNTSDALGSYSYTSFFRILNAMLKGEEKNVIQLIGEYYNNGHDLKIFVSQFLTFCLDVDKYLLFQSFDMTKIPQTMQPELNSIAAIQNASETISYYLDNLLELRTLIKNDVDPKSIIEVTLLKMMRKQ